jgi:hypothetical protein
LRARLRRAAASTALAGAALAVSAAPAAAAEPAIRIQSVSSERVASGESVRVRFEATNNNQRTEKVFVAVSGGLECAAGCAAAPDIKSGQSKTFTATVVAPQVGPAEESGRNLAVSVRIGTETAFDHRMIIVVGTNKPSPSAVSRFSGRVRDAGGKAIDGATVTVRDSAGHDFRTASDGSGRFSITPGESKPLAAGPLEVTAAKDGYRTARATVRGTAGRAATVRLTLAAVAAPATSPPSPTAEASPPAAADEPASLAAAPPPATTGTADDAGSGLLLFTVLGGILIAAGLGTLVLMLIRRRNSRDGGHSSPAVVGAAPATGGGMADAPTAVLRLGAQQHGYDRQ